MGGAPAHLHCDLATRLEIADHTIFVGRVREVRMGHVGEPLVYFRRAYRALAPFADAARNGRTLWLAS